MRMSICGPEDHLSCVCRMSEGLRVRVKQRVVCRSLLLIFLDAEGLAKVVVHWLEQRCQKYGLLDLDVCENLGICFGVKGATLRCLILSQVILHA